MSNRHDEWWKTQATHVDIADKNLKLEDCLDNIKPVFKSKLKDKGLILDYGCGIGRVTIPMAQSYNTTSFVGYDISERFLNDARQFAKNKLTNLLFTTIIDGLKFDAIYSMFVMQHLPQPAKKKAIKQMASSLKPGGLLRLQYVEGENHSFLTHDATYQDIDKWCADAGLHILDVEYNLLESRWTWITAVKG